MKTQKKRPKQFSSLAQSSLWQVRFRHKGDIGDSTAYITLNSESRKLNQQVLDCLGFILFCMGGGRATIKAAEYLGVCYS